MNKKNNNKGFTLAELLIVVAIIAVLVAIAIPVFTSQLEKSREATDAANIRSAYADVMVQAIDEPTAGSSLTKPVELKQQNEGWTNTALKQNLVDLFSEDSGASDALDSVSTTNKWAHINWVKSSGTGSSAVEGHITITVDTAKS